jgi:ribosomal protein S18 acetylase RimI-like enzyme
MEEKKYTLNDGREIELRPIQIMDREQLINFYQEIPSHTQTLSPDLIDLRFRYPRYYIGLVTIHENQLVGYGEIEETQEQDRGELIIHIHPDYQGLGLGTAMMIMLLNEANSRDLSHINLKVTADNLGALRLFRKFGFKEESTEKKAINGKKFEILYMNKTLVE